MTERLRTVLVFLVPIFAVVTVVFGLRMGGRGAVLAANVYVASHPDNAAPALEVSVFLDDRGVQEPAGVQLIKVMFERCGARTTREVTTNAQGVAVLMAPPGDGTCPLEVRVTHPREAWPLAAGRVQAVQVSNASTPVAPEKRAGGQGAIELLAPSGRLPVGVPGWLVVRARSLAGSDATWTFESEAAEVTRAPGYSGPLCKEGLLLLRVTPRFPVASLSVHGQDVQGHTLDWFGPLPTLPGGARLERVSGKDELRVTLAGARPAMYVGFFGPEGVTAAHAIDAGDPAFARAATEGLSFPVPPGASWAYATSDPPSSLTQTYRDHTSIGYLGSLATCQELERVLQGGRPEPPLPALVLEGLPVRRHQDDVRRVWGYRLAFAGLAFGAFTQVLLLVLGARRAAAERRAFAKVANAENEDAADIDPTAGAHARDLAAAEPTPLWISLGIGVGLVALVFAMLGGILLLRIEL